MKNIFLFILCFQLTIGLSQEMLDNRTKLESHIVFEKIEILVPEVAKRLQTNKEMAEEMGFAKFASGDEKIEITFRKMEKVNLSEVKTMMDGMSESLYNGKIVRSEIIEINKIKVFVTDIKGQWNGAGEFIGMFRYYFNAEGDSYNLLMQYPADSIDKTKELKDKMINSIRIN
jgi:hypothetical protein